MFLTRLLRRCRVKGLPTKKKYRFRLLAENLAGPGKASSETDPVLIKDPIGMATVINRIRVFLPRWSFNLSRCSDRLHTNSVRLFALLQIPPGRLENL